MHLDDTSGHLKEIGDCLFDVSGSFNEEVVHCLCGRDGSPNCFERWRRIKSSIIFNDIHNMSRTRLH